MPESIGLGFERLAAAWLAWAGPALMSALLAVALAGCAALLLRRRSAALRHALWVLVVLRLLLPPQTGMVVRLGDAGTLLRWVIGLKAESHMIADRAKPDAQAGPGGQSLGMVPLDAGTTGGLAQSAAPIPAGPRHSAPGSVVILFTVWLAGAALLALLNAFRLLRLRRRFRDLQPVTGGEVYALFERCRDRLGIPPGRGCRLFVTGALSSPCVCGLLRPRVILPARLLEGISPAELEPLLLDELAHVRRWDLAVIWLQLAAQIAHWPNPLVWWVNRRIRLEREQACDDCVLATTRFRPRDYGAGLIRVLELGGRETALAPGLLGLTEQAGAMQRRLRLIMDPCRPRVARLSPLARVGVVLAGVTLVWVAPTLGPAEAPVPPSPTPQAVQEGHGLFNRTLRQEMTSNVAFNPNGLLRLDNINGSVTVSPWDKAEVEIMARKELRLQGKARRWSDAEAQQYFAQLRVDIQGAGDKVTVRTIQPEHRSGANTNVTYEIRLPRQARLDLRSTNGAIAISGVKGEIKAHTTNGQIKTESTVGAAELLTSNGGIDCGDLRGRLVAHTTNGQVRIERRTPPSADETLSAETTNGGVTLTLPENSAFNVQAESGTGKIHSDFALPAPQGLVGQHLSGQVGTGGPEIHLKTVNGSITLKTGAPAAAPASPEKSTTATLPEKPISAAPSGQPAQTIPFRF